MTKEAQYWGESSNLSSGNNQEYTEDDHMSALVLFTRHVPRINSFIPDISDASMDHHRLLQRLNTYGLSEVKVSGDGNCQFRALSDQLFKSPKHHKHVRKEIVKQLKDHHSLYECYVPMKYKQYCKKMAKSGEWGDHVTLQAASDKV
ncbi:hypothetical protein Fmac_029389 [Flemingia macrophylla]|uniref:OTU domain-containing protein n=1 Tax=Flemingia macrophylla TaxID=520843 RepID=A0ABD1LBR8_9FABA